MTLAVTLRPEYPDDITGADRRYDALDAVWACHRLVQTPPGR